MTKQNDLVTKQYLESRLNSFKDELVEELEEKMFKPQRDYLAGLKDEIIGRFDAWGQDDEVHKFSHQRLNDETSDHELRIASLESKTKD